MSSAAQRKVRFREHDDLSLYIFIISQLRLTSHPRSTVVLLDTETPGTSREIYSEDVAQWLEHWVCNPGVASSSLTFGMTIYVSSGRNHASLWTKLKNYLNSTIK